MDFSGKQILVTGASSGIGRDLCVLLSNLGARVVLVGRNEARLRETISMMQPGEHIIEPFDVTNHLLADEWMKGIVAKVGPLHGLAHVAGKTHTAALRHMEWSVFDELIDVNLKSAFAMIKAFRAKQVRATPSATVVFVASVAAIRGFPGLSIYSAAKGAVIAMTRTLASELSREGIRVNCVVPGLVKTEMTADMRDLFGDSQWAALQQRHLLGLGTPRDVSQAISFLLSDEARWITGEAMVVDGGLTIH
jgi:NAD(P)-dependent dehydrogenase (short-subunit alcohol dehydrogenase family)